MLQLGRGVAQGELGTIGYGPLEGGGCECFGFGYSAMREGLDFRMGVSAMYIIGSGVSELGWDAAGEI